MTTGTVEQLVEGYAPEEERPPLVPYAALAAVWNGSMLAFLAWHSRSGRPLPERTGGRDLVLLGVATHKLSRLITKEKVTSFVRAPFTELQGKAGPGEVEERPRGGHLRRAVGESLTCPFCIGLWIAGAFSAGLAVDPARTRFVAGIFNVLTISDFLQIGYKAAERQGLEG